MIISNAERGNEIQRLRTLADLLELMGVIEEDTQLTKPDIATRIHEIIQTNYLYESPNIYTKKL